MDKRPKKTLGVVPSSTPTASRKHSLYDKPSQTAKDRRRTLSHDSQGGEAGDEDSISDFAKNELLIFKTSFAKPRLANTYRMEPYKKFEAHVVRKKAEEILKSRLQDYNYNGVTGASTCGFLAEEILAAFKDYGYDRYKYLVQVFIVEKTGQSIHISSRWVWDVTRDNWVSVQHETENYVALALIVAVYYE